MKTKLALSILFFCGILAFTSCSNSASKSEVKTETEQAKVQYTCPMHPEIIQDKPGKCPKCGMDLVKK